jgi:peptide/nickel transport system substrate-binding protein
MELYDKNGNRVRFSLYTNAGNSVRNTECLLIVSDLAKLGIAIDYKVLDFATLVQYVDRTFQYDAVLLGLNRTDIDPGERRNMLLSSGALHFWWPRQEKPFTPWEGEIDQLMLKTMSTSNTALRKQYYSRVQRILSEQQPMIFTIHPYVFVCVRAGLENIKPSILRHRTLWNAEELYWEN